MKLNYRAYAGIGSRSTPPHILEFMRILAFKLGSQEDPWTGRSGHADGADDAFEVGMEQANGPMEIFLPWRGMANSRCKSDSPYYEIKTIAYDLASRIHPKWYGLTHGAKKLHARNTYQVLGYDHQTWSKAVVCYTSDGLPIGGTRTAIKIAEMHGIPVINLGDPECKYETPDQVVEYLNSL
ncbi:DNA recombination-mediator protein [Rhizobium phage RHph_TM39]|uniref:DNA recombination-mediator protein n=2 Tax=Cuauhnahuacvirus TaxID=3044696 RepID=A0A7S5RC73_9CAUD|nr:DNA recombination-mediator protein [Rhizobium phage RHph_TM30]YP_010671417.1 DNA recombination-mediator protein [Rhizobium phage RHph_Y65]QIG71738.1 DNA recombination-mediator protein [Rhizobium phage RHph_TM40]QIG72101.1 DNA recombination-mediator protein [Rhizobium phage RHph_TM2_3B]QIG72463.1 DNA recombination-mediator protein [Rhizobium phage RHph_TM3_3_6]QIG77236.1 DNA recombination-mediator protein [Rhizobium phage RHph_TM39]QIG77536.1 DNA recombination-mediator protein [Rhizobium ph